MKAFARFQRRERITDRALAKAVGDAGAGLIDADLGGGLIKQRVARSRQGKSGGYRTLIAFRRGDRAVFLFGFAKSDMENVGEDEVEAWRRIARLYLGLDANGLKRACDAKELLEVDYGATEPE